MEFVALVFAFVAFLWGWTANSKLTRLVNYLKEKDLLENDYK